MKTIETEHKGHTPLFIAIEGIDGSGKTTYLNYINNQLEAQGKKTVIFSFPEYDSFFGKEIGYLLSGKGDINANDVDPKSMSLWYALDRWNKLKNIDYTQYDYVFFNRYTLSSIIYQSIRYGKADNEIRDWIIELEHGKLSLPIPDTYFIIDISTDLSSLNIDKKGHRDYVGEEKDVYEKTTNLLEEARKKYLNIEIPKSKKIIIKASENKDLKKIETVGDEILSMIQ
ncbi:dTMP kinase [Spirochaeta cellobiosiphila]|uniref:dTMP kinase n=1 Tax=Spirochaeta cellobiosiphila TaxID=504483 RepID=UPI0004099001|nr:hypothetical protein [Spirochaeta cellobiosiphila]